MRSLSILAAAGTLTLVIGASPAPAQTPHSLTLTGPSTATVAQPTVLQATGTVSDDPSVFFDRFVKVYAIPTSTVSSCPATPASAIDLSYASSAQGGKTVSSGAPVEGSFSVPIAFTPDAPGGFLLCGYLTEGFNSADATASHIVQVAGPTGGGPTGGGPVSAVKPANVTKPKVRRSGRTLVCSRGTWSGRPTSYAYQWRVNGKRRKGATTRRLRVTRQLRGRKIQCGVTATNGAGASTSLSRNLRVR